MTPEDRLAALGIELPPALPPNANYVPFRLHGETLYLSGHGPRRPDNTYIRGYVETVDHVAAAYEDAQLTALNMLATVKLAIGELARVQAVIKLLGMVHSAPQFSNHSQVIDGCSDLLLAAFGDRGRHARSAVGMASLPHGMTVEIEAILHVR